MNTVPTDQTEMSNTKTLFDALEELSATLQSAHEMAQDASEEAAKYGGEWEQETSTDLDGITVRIRGIISDLESITQEARTLRGDTEVRNKEIRDENEDEEISRESVEEVQDKIAEKEWRKEQI